jgi:hypothetical protein
MFLANVGKGWLPIILDVDKKLKRGAKWLLMNQQQEQQ